jgi:hypothetical protein
VQCNGCPGYGLTLSSGIESWRGITTGSFPNSSGGVVESNLGLPVPGLRCYGIGAQLGIRYGAYNLDGHPSGLDPPQEESDIQQQMFITAGLFHRASGGSRINAGMAFDWMMNDAFGSFSTAPFLTQWRAQIGYLITPHDEFGVWSALRDRGDSKFDGFITYRPVSQVNAFWHHNYQSGADSWLWLGAPVQQMADGEGNVGEITLGIMLTVPLTERWALYANGQYMRPSIAAGNDAAIEDAYSLGFGLTFYPGGHSRNCSAAGNCWMPYMPVANNGSFLVDTNLPFGVRNQTAQSAQ